MMISLGLDVLNHLLFTMPLKCDRYPYLAGGGHLRYSRTTNNNSFVVKHIAYPGKFKPFPFAYVFSELV